MPSGWAWAVDVGIVGYIAGIVLFCLRGIGPGGRLRQGEATWYIVLSLASFLLWVVGLLKA